MQSLSALNVVHESSRFAHNRGGVDAALLKPLQALHHRQQVLLNHTTNLSPGVGRAAISSAFSTAEEDQISRVKSSLNDLQQLAANLDSEPNTDGLLTAYQQLCLIQKRVLQEQRKRQAAIARTKWRSSYRSGQGTGAECAPPRSGSLPHSGSTKAHQVASRCGLQNGPVAEAAGTSASSASSRKATELLELKQLRQTCDDAQDFLVNLIQAHLQDEPPAAAARLLTAAAYRQLNNAAINRTCVNTFLEKQAAAGPSDMAALMSALALVRCCSRGSHEVEGLGRGQLAALFGGTMTHLIGHVERVLQDSRSSQQQQCGINDGPSSVDSSTRRRRRPTAATTASRSSAGTTSTVSMAVDEAVDAIDLRRQVAAAVAAHVSGRVPLNSALIPHIMQLLGDEAPAWLHPVTALQSASSVSQLQQLISHPSRHDYTYLAAGLHKLSELVEQQQQQQLALSTGASPPATTTELVQAGRLAQKLYGRLQQLQADATAAEIVCVLAAAAKMGVTDGKAYATAAIQFVEGPQLQQASDVQVASVMYAVACYSSSSNGSGSSDASFSRQQQQHVLKQCVFRMCTLIKEQQQPGGKLSKSGYGVTAAASSKVDPASVVMAVWALATARPQMRRALTGRLFNFLAEPSTVHALLPDSSTSSSSSSSDSAKQQKPHLQAARTCCSVIWAAAQLQQPQVLSMLQAYLAGFMRALPVIPVACTSITTVLQSLAALLAAHQQQQQQAGQSNATEGAEADHWRAVFLRCSDEIIKRLQQQTQDSANSSAAGDGQQSVSQQAVVTAANQLVWAHEVAGITLPNTQLMTLLHLLKKQAPSWLLELAVARASTPAAIVDLLDVHAAADLACIAAAFTRLADLKAQREAAVSGTAETTTAGPQQQTEDLKLFNQQVKECAQRLSAIAEQAGIPDVQLLQRQQQQPILSAQPQQQCSSMAAAASAAATILLSTSRLQHKDTRLCSSCIQLFHAAAAAATPEAATAVISAMATAGRKLPVMYCDQGPQVLQEVLRACTTKVFAATLALRAAQAQSPGKKHRQPRCNRADSQQQSSADAPGDMAHAVFRSGGLADVLVTQNILQLHAVLQAQLAPQQLAMLLAAATDEAALSVMKDKTAAAALIGCLSAVAELRQTSGGCPEAQQNASQAAAAAYERQQLLQELLMYGLLPRIGSATPKQIATSLEAVADLAVGPAGVTAGSSAAPILELSLARDYARALFAELLATTDTADDAAASINSSGAASPLSGWKGEHVASVAVAAMRLDVACPTFFAAVEADLAVDDASAATHEAAAVSPAPGSQLPQQTQSRIQNVQMQHLVTVCCAAAALHCRVERLLVHSLGTAQSLLLSQAASSTVSGEKQWQQQQSRQRPPAQQQPVDQTQIFLLAWCTAAMDAPQLQQQAKQLVAAACDADCAGTYLTSKAGKQQGVPTAAAASRVSLKLSDQVLFGTAGLAARMFQLHVWLADRQVQMAQQRQQQHWLDYHLSTATAEGGHGSTVAGVSVQAAEVGFGLDLGLSGILSQEQLQKAGQQWSQLQVAAAPAGQGQQLVAGDWRLAAVAEVLQQVSGVEGLSAMTATADGWVRLDLEARIRGVPVAVLLLHDSDEDYILGGVSYAARHLVPQQQTAVVAGTAAATAAGTSDGRKQARRPHQHVTAASTPLAAQQAVHSDSRSSTVVPASTFRRPLSTYELLQECLGCEHTGDVMFRARALAARGYWVAVVSWQEWSSLGGDESAELAYLQDKLWLLLQDPQEVQGQERAAVGVPVVAVAAVTGEERQGTDPDPDKE